jgi:hypothetical protein
MVSAFPRLPQPLKLKLALSVSLLIPSGRWLQAEVFSFSLAFVFSMRITPCSVRHRYPWCTRFSSCKMELSVVDYWPIVRLAP